MNIDTNQTNSEVFNHYLKLSTPTEEDFKRVFTEDELKELCLKHKCKVNMWKWNVVDEYRLAFIDSGRFQRWSEHDRLGMLAKAVNKMKPSVLYSEEEIIKVRRNEWEEQLKENILSLNYWKRQRDGNPRLQSSDSNDIAREVLTEFEVNTESMNPDEILTETEARNTQTDNTQSLMGNSHREVHIEMVRESMNLIETPDLNMESERDLATPEIIEGNIVFNSADDDELMIDGDSKDSEETVLHNRKQHVVETLNSEEVAPDIQNMYDVNTVSMTLDSQISTQSENLAMLQSQDVIPQSYENFKNIIPLTSTQSQNHESEGFEIIS